MHSLVRRQLRKAFPGSGAVPPELATFVEAVSDAYTAADADRQQLERSLELASEELFQRNGKLEAQVAELTRLERALAKRTEDLDLRNRDMAVILDNVAQGFVTVALDGSLAAERSAAFTSWFDAELHDRDARIWTVLFGHDANLEAWMELGFLSLRNEVMPLDVVLAQLPTSLERKGRSFRVEYRPIGTPPTALLVVLSDITDEIERERAERCQRQLVSVVERAYRDRSGFLAFLRDTNELLARCQAPGVTEGEIKRHLHTLKGNAALFGVMTISEICHALESQLEDVGAAAAPQGEAPAPAWTDLFDRWFDFHQRVATLLGVSERRTILVDWDEYQAVLAEVGGAAASSAPAPGAPPAWAARIRRWGEDSTKIHLERFGEQARQIAQRLGKPELDVEIVDNGLTVDRDRFAPLWSALVHSVRNAVDHGIEPAERRQSEGKPERGQLSFLTELRGDTLVVEIRDDGGGIDWNGVASRAGELGLPTGTSKDLEEAVFAEGMSTVMEVTEVSGRGIGMSALRATCVELGGDVELISGRGCGTTVRCLIPLAPPPPAPAAPASRTQQIPRQVLAPTLGTVGY